VTPLINAHRATTKSTLENDVGPEFEAGVDNAHAGMNDMVVVEKAKLWKRYLDNVDQFAASVRFEMNKERHRTKAELAKAGAGLSQVWVALEDLRTKVSLTRAQLRWGHVIDAVKLGDGVAGDAAGLRMKYAAVRAEQGWRHWLWPLEVHSFRNQAIAALPGGAGGQPGKDSVAASVLSGALAGAAIGGETPGKHGSLWGAVIGAFAGFALK